MNYDCIIIGAGPAGIYAAYEFYLKAPNLKILLIDKGKDIYHRHCPRLEHKLGKCPVDKNGRSGCHPSCSITNGFGGAGAFSDGKFNITSEFGGWMTEYLPEETVEELINYVDQINLNHGATQTITDPMTPHVREIERRAIGVGLKLLRAKVRHIGTEQNLKILESIYEQLKSYIDYRFNSEVTDLIIENNEIKGVENIDKIINIDQSPIGRAPRSNPATYTGVFDTIRDIFANTNEAKMRGYQKGRFSFNVSGGRCEACQGDGIIKIEMNFLPDIYVPCEVCHGRRYNRETVEVKYKGKSISDVLDMTVEEALEFFSNIPKIKTKMQTLFDVGLGYIKLGQPSTTLSGGEAQRVKLATELSKRATGKTLYILDEPTTGLHIDDVHRLVDILQRLVDTGNTIIVIEHNLDLIKTADHIIDLGPEGGEAGGRIIAVGTPEQIARNPESQTGIFLKKYLD